MRIAPIFPSRGQSLEIPWSGAVARRQLVHGFNSRNASSRSFNLIRSKLVSLPPRAWLADARSCLGNAKCRQVLRFSKPCRGLEPGPAVPDIPPGPRSPTRDDQEIFGIEPDTTIVEFFEDSHSSEVLRGYVPEGQELIIIPRTTAEGPLSRAARERPCNSALPRDAQVRRADDFICDLPPVFANDDAAIIMESLDGDDRGPGRQDHRPARSKQRLGCSDANALPGSFSTNTGAASSAKAMA